MSRYLRMVTLDPPGAVVATGSKRKADRYQLNFAVWRKRLAAPGSRFEPDRSVSARIVSLAAASLAGDAAQVERRTA